MGKLATALLLLSFLVCPALAGDPQLCDEPGEAPDILVGEMIGINRWGTIDGITAYSPGSDSCNSGTCWLDFFPSTAAHPVFGQNLYRLDNGRFEQIGMSWVVHRYFALSSTLCDTGCLPTNGQHLGVSCSSADSATINGGQFRMGPRAEVNPATGEFPFPATDMNLTGNAIYKRLQVHDVDLDPQFNPGALYFLEGVTVAPEDALAGNANNNASYRQVVVGGGGGGVFNLAIVGETQRGKPAIIAWGPNDTDVTFSTVDVPGDGRFIVASKATPLGGGVWNYEYAIENLTSHRAAMSVALSVPPSAEVSAIGFHDVDYHSGERIDGTDWTAVVNDGVSPTEVRWSTQSFDENPDANALRWGTLYNFRFNADVPPSTTGTLQLGLFRQSLMNEVTVPVVAPECLADDSDADTVVGCLDCDDGNSSAWAIPGEVTGLTLERTPGAAALLTWNAPDEAGATTVAYEALRSTDSADFLSSSDCLTAANAEVASLEDGAIPSSGTAFFYLVRAVNACPAGVGTLGFDSAAIEREGADCN